MLGAYEGRADCTPLMRNLSLMTDALELVRCILKAMLPLLVVDRMDCLRLAENFDPKRCSCGLLFWYHAGTADICIYLWALTATLEVASVKQNILMVQCRKCISVSKHHYAFRPACMRAPGRDAGLAAAPAAGYAVLPARTPHALGAAQHVSVVHAPHLLQHVVLCCGSVAAMREGDAVMLVRIGLRAIGLSIVDVPCCCLIRHMPYRLHHLQFNCPSHGQEHL